MESRSQQQAAPGVSPSGAAIKHILIVDKPRFSRLIQRMLVGRFEVTCVEDALGAIRSMQYRRPDVVVADLNVAGGGMRLAELMEMNVRFAHTPFVLTCIKPTGDLIQKIKSGAIDSLLVKPFPPSALVEQVGMLLANGTRRHPLPDDEEDPGIAAKIKDRMLGIDGLPPFPATQARVMELANSDEADSDDIAEQIQLDPSFLATVLKLANSAHYGFTRRVDSLKLAVTLLGFKEISNLVMSLQVFNELGDYDQQSGFDLNAFWKHSVGTAFIARAIAQKLNAEVEVAFMGGLLHDIGKVVLDRYFAEFFGETLRRIEEERVLSTEAERLILGISHAQVGGYLAANWKFSDPLMEAIVCHHNPSLARHFIKLASVVNVANAICTHLEYGSSGEVLKPIPGEGALSKALWKLGLGPQAFGKLADIGQAQLQHADSFLSVLSNSSSD